MVVKRSCLQIQLKALAEEMQAIIKGLEKVKQELSASENDGPVSVVFHKVSWPTIKVKLMLEAQSWSALKVKLMFSYKEFFSGLKIHIEFFYLLQNNVIACYCWLPI